jgi:hypothetical protein
MRQHSARISTASCGVQGSLIGTADVRRTKRENVDSILYDLPLDRRYPSGWPLRPSLCFVAGSGDRDSRASRCAPGTFATVVQTRQLSCRLR